jgi:Domain of unknown function (DUF4440)
MTLPKKSVVSIGVIAMMVFAGFAAGSARGQTAAPQGELNEAQVLALQKKFQDASVAADHPTLSALMDDNATFIHGSGVVQTKAEYIDSLTSGKMKFTTYELKGSKVVFFKGGAIVVGLTDVGLAPPRSAPASTPTRILHMRVSAVWLRKLDGWHLILSQGTPLAGP